MLRYKLGKGWLSLAKFYDFATFTDTLAGLSTDATASFNGAVYDHSNGAHNALSMLRVGVILGGVEVEAEKMHPPRGLKIFEGPSLRAEAQKNLTKAEKAKKVKTEKALPAPLTIAA